MINNYASKATNDLRDITNGIVELSKILDTNLKGHEQEKTAHQMKLSALRLRNMLAPLLGTEEVTKRYTIFDEKREPLHSITKDSNSGQHVKYGAHILVVEDQKYHQIVAKEVLNILGCTTDFVDNSEEAVLMMLETHYDLIFVDIDINGTSGIDVAKRYRIEEPFEPRVPIVAMTSMTSPATHEGCSSAGMDAIIEKPYEINKMLEILPYFLTVQEPETTSNEAASLVKK